MSDQAVRDQIAAYRPRLVVYVRSWGHALAHEAEDAALLVVALPVLLWVSGSKPSAFETEVARGWVRIDGPARCQQVEARLTEQLQMFGGRPQRNQGETK